MKHSLFGLLTATVITGCDAENSESYTEPLWLNGVYVNKDKDSLLHEVIFCEYGKAYAGMDRRIYQTHTKDNVNYITLQSNGTFTFTASADLQELLPADSFTSDWFTKSGLQLDSSRDDTCNW